MISKLVPLGVTESSAFYVSDATEFGVRFGRLIREKRGIEGLTQQQLSVIAFGTEDKKARISELENGRISNPHQRVVDALTIALDLTKSEILGCHGSNFLELPDELLEQLGISRDLAVALTSHLPTTPNVWNQEALRIFLENKVEEIQKLLTRCQDINDQQHASSEIMDTVSQAIGAGSFEKAEQLILGLEHQIINQKALPELVQLEKYRKMRGETALLQGNIDAAGDIFESAAQIYAGFNRNDIVASRLDAFEKLHWHGRKFDSDALKIADCFLERNLKIIDKSKHKIEWGNHNRQLALNLQFVGFRQGGAQGVATLRKALNYHKRALSVFKKSLDLERWKECKNNEAIAHRFLGTRGDNEFRVFHIELAIQGYEEIEASLTPEKTIELARTRVNLASALVEKAKLGSDREIVLKTHARAILSAEYSLGIYMEKQNTRNAAISHNNLGEAKFERAKSGFSLKPANDLDEAVKHFHQFQSLQPKEDDLFQWAEANENIGDVLAYAFENHFGGTSYKLDAITFYELAIEGFCVCKAVYNIDKCGRKIKALESPSEVDER